MRGPCRIRVLRRSCEIPYGCRASSGTGKGTGFAIMNAEAIEDADLVRRFNGGDETAFVDIMDRHRARIFAAAMALLRNRADAEEITQDTFVRAHRGLPSFRG